MRVLLVAHRYPPDSVAGVERYTEALADELTAGGDVVTVITRRIVRPGHPGGVIRETAANGVRIIRIVGGAPDISRFLDQTADIEQLFIQTLIEAEPEIVHVNHLVMLSPRLMAIAHRLRIPVVLSLHDFYLACTLVHLQRSDGSLCEGPAGGIRCGKTCFAAEGPFGVVRWGLRTSYFKHLLTTPDRVICYSKYVATFFERFGAHGTHIQVIPNGVPADLAHQRDPIPLSDDRAGDASRRLRIAYCGVVVAHKGVHLILEALRLARIDKVDIVILGDTPVPEYVAELHALAARIPDIKLIVHGAYERAELPFLLADADCVVLPSQVPEAGPISPREALACGVPVITSDLGALPEVVDVGRNGYTFRADRPIELAAILQELAESPSLRHRLRQGARATPVITVTDHARAVRSVYDDVINRFDEASATYEKDGEEMEFLEVALARVGFGGTP